MRVGQNFCSWGTCFLNRALRDHVYDLASDGRFLMVTNFFKVLKKRLPN